MDLVIDANVVMSALIKDNFTRFLLFREKLRLYAPEFMFVEIEKYTKEICEKTRCSKEQVDEVLNVIMRRITIVPKEDFETFINQAAEFTPDLKDTVYLALALKLNIPLWSQDKALKEKQNKVIVYNTNEVKDNS